MANRLSDYFPKGSIPVPQKPASRKKRIHSPVISTFKEKEDFYDPNAKGYFSEQKPTKKNVYSTEYTYDADENWKKKKSLAVKQTKKPLTQAKTQFINNIYDKKGNRYESRSK